MTTEEWAVTREKELRERSYREAMLWEKGVEEALQMNGIFKCPDPEGAWVQMLRDDLHSVKA